ncbi:class I SAM-dependent methyltransferase [Clostridium magnum]|uniref:Methyltransferase type 11 domain-containing protein n=1 Tax=Clostridium magnum DSM 2767 TaxID=1121326 RepID=A0A161WYB4_9CLOT|nr:class I SAM-dependent methyltransferase [Clostridium magnum]KZL92068.1 hypothetical protein CLMAG_18740 [Clostridium magnum DSM 2767]SHH23777.1 Methyltransferase domain-containing protein [Clostridium magnum DSM 2767]
MDLQNMVKDNWSKAAEKYINNIQKEINSFKRNAQESGVNPNFHVMDSHSLDFEDESFDLIISRNVDWNLKELKKVYKNWFNLLKKDGRVVIFGEDCFLKVLIECGFQKIIVKKDILNSIYTDKKSSL